MRARRPGVMAHIGNRSSPSIMPRSSSAALTGPGLGSASIQIDGKSKGTVSEAGTAKTRVRLDRIFFATPGTHTLRIDVQSGTFKLDAITVTPH